ncbi:MAG TPA: thioredoxin-like domain-containing protein, partial [Pirellulales bacterium]|nr:thioredoxin-like domain-containing protein [Pirellulales bacterium]
MHRCLRTDRFAWLALVLCVAFSIGCGQNKRTVAAEQAEDDRPKTSDKSQSAATKGASGNSNNQSAKKGDTAAQKPTAEHPFARRSPAPSLDGGLGWINTSKPIDVKDLSGKFVLLDFWTYCCINCIHVLPELKKLERAYPNELVVIGVHSAKFEGEQDSQNITDAVLRYEIEHPVVNDADHKIWNRYGVNSWPSFRVIDPEGNLVAQGSGEMKFEEFDAFFKAVLPYYRENKLLDARPLKFDLESAKVARTPLRFPGKLLADEAGGRLFIADSNHNRIIIATLEGKLLEIIGTGAIGRRDGDYRQAQFDHPQGMALRGETLYVADTENHLLRKVDLKAKRVTTIAGTGAQGRNAWPGVRDDAPLGGFNLQLPERFIGPPKTTAINSPWALYIHGADLFIAMAGPHQIWKMPLDESEIGPYAGNGREDIADGRLLPRVPYQRGSSSFAQPSGLAGDKNWLYVADSEGSAIRAVPFDPSNEVETVIGTQGSLFTFGDVDGGAGEARLQHALGVVHHEGVLYVADTYNNKIKVIDPKARTSRSLVGTGKPGKSDLPAAFDEPAGISYAAGKLYVADTNNHLIRTIDLKSREVKTLTIAGLAPPALAAAGSPPAAAATPGKRPTFRNAAQVKLDPVALRPKDGAIALKVDLQLPDGWHMNPLAPSVYVVDATSAEGPVQRAALGQVAKVNEPTETFEIPVKLAAT